jgi:hypothetical protein
VDDLHDASPLAWESPELAYVLSDDAVESELSTPLSPLGPLWAAESPSLVLVINDTKLLMPCVKCFELGISNTCDEGVCGKEWWPQDHKEMVHEHEMMIMVEMHIK